MTHSKQKVLLRTHWLALVVSLMLAAHSDLSADEIITLDGAFGSVISLGAGLDEVRALDPERVEPVAADDHRAPSSWYYFNSRGIRMRVCGDDQRVGTINATVAPVTEKYVTEAGVRIGDSLEETKTAYGDRLQAMPESEGTIWYVDDEDSNNRLTFGFTGEGDMTWVALGTLRENGWTCGQSPN